MVVALLIRLAVCLIGLASSAARTSSPIVQVSDNVDATAGSTSMRSPLVEGK